MPLPYTEMHHIQHLQYIQIEEAEWKHPSAEKGEGGPESITSHEFHRRTQSLWFRCSRDAQGVPSLVHINDPSSNPQPLASCRVGAIIFCNNGFKSIKYDPLLDPNPKSNDTEYWESMGFKFNRDEGTWLFGRIEPNTGYEQDIPSVASNWYRYLFRDTSHANADENHNNSETLPPAALTSIDPLWIWGLAAFYFSLEDLVMGFDQIFNHNHKHLRVDTKARYPKRTIIVRIYDQYPGADASHPTSPALLKCQPSNLTPLSLRNHHLY